MPEESTGTGTDEYLGVELYARYGGEFQRRVQVQVQTSTLGLNSRPGNVARARGESGTGTDEYLGVELYARYCGSCQRRIRYR